MSNEIETTQAHFSDGSLSAALAGSRPSQSQSQNQVSVVELVAHITRFVPDELIYVVTDAGKSFVFTLDKIIGYRGQAWRTLRIREGLEVTVVLGGDRKQALKIKRLLVR